MRSGRGAMCEAKGMKEDDVRVWRKRRQTEWQMTISQRVRREKMVKSNSNGSSMIALELTTASGADSAPRFVSISPFTSHWNEIVNSYVINEDFEIPVYNCIYERVLNDSDSFKYLSSFYQSISVSNSLFSSDSSPYHPDWWFESWEKNKKYLLLSLLFAKLVTPTDMKFKHILEQSSI